MMDTAGTVVKITDFGTSKVTSPTTMAKTLVGTQLYLAPELAAAFFGTGPRCYTSAVDIWALGCILYFMLSRSTPFGDSENTFPRIIKAEYSFDDPVWGSVSEAAKDLISRLLVKGPEERLTASEILAHPWCLGRSTLTASEKEKLDQKFAGGKMKNDRGMAQGQRVVSETGRLNSKTLSVSDSSITSEDSMEERALQPPDTKKIDTRPECMYGAKCYRKNPEHFKQFKHSFLNK